MSSSEEDAKLNDKNGSRTRIPISKFRQTVEKVKAERRGSNESHIPVRRTSIPKLKKDKNVKREINISKADDEFDKIYNEIVSTPTEINIDILNPKVDDPEKIESTFEEIIHDYDERVEPEVEVRRSKIPFLRKNQETGEERTSKIIAARDKVRLRHSLSKGEDLAKELDKELNKASPNDSETVKVIEHQIISSPNSELDITRAVSRTVSVKNNTENNEHSNFVETVTVKEVANGSDDKKGSKHLLIEENIVKDSIKIGIPVFDSQKNEVSEISETSNTVEVKRVFSYTKGEDFSSNKVINEKDLISNNTFENHFSRELNVFFTENKDNKLAKNFDKLKLRTDDSVEIKDVSEQEKEVDLRVKNNPKDIKEDNTEEIKEEDIVQLRGKVERIISKIDSKEIIETDGNERESINELRKKKSVLSKIAMFERADVETPVKSRIPKHEITLKTNKEHKTEHTHIHTPLIVDEVFKFQRETNLNDEGNNADNPLKKGEISIEYVTVTPNSVQYAVENKVKTELATENNYNNVNVQPKIDFNNTIHKGGIATITDVTAFNKESLPTPDIKDVYEYDYKIDKNSENAERKEPKFENDAKFNKFEENLNNVNAKYKEEKIERDEPLTPGYKTVSELLKSFESKTPKRTRRHFSREFSAKEIDKIDNEPENIEITPKFDQISPENVEDSREFHNFESINEYKSLDDVFTSDLDMKKLKLRQEDDFKRTKSLAELDLGYSRGKVSDVIRMISVDRADNRREEKINVKEMPRKRSVSEKIALFEGKLTPSRGESHVLRIYKPEKILEFSRIEKKEERKITKFERRDMEHIKKEVVYKEDNKEDDEERIKKIIEELRSAKVKYGKIENMPIVELSNGMTMPALAVGTAMLDPRLIYHIITAAIELGYRAIDTAYIYGNEQQVGEAVRAKIDDGTVKREDLFIISKLWSTHHRTDLVEGACRESLVRLGLEYVDLYLVHNPMSFKEGAGPIPKIATVLQYSEHDYLDAWYGMETLVTKGLARAIGVSNFNSVQLQRVLDKGRIKPVINQVECHPYLSQQRLDNFCAERNVTLSCFGVLGSKGTPMEYKNVAMAAIDDALVQVMASGLNMTPAQLLIRYQLDSNRSVVVKASTAAHLWDNLQAVNLRLTSVEVDALNALNRNRRTFTFKGMGDTHKNYPFNIAF